MKRRNGAHPIAWNQCAVDFGPGDPDTMTAAAIAQRRQRLLVYGQGSRSRPPGMGREEFDRRKPVARAILRRPVHVRDELGIWMMPHAVSLADPFTTVCGLPYSKGMEVPSVWDHGQQVVSFEGLDYRMQCHGCLGLIWADPEA